MKLWRLTIRKVEHGYIGVKGVETVERTLVAWGWQYTGNLEVLNGVPYTIVVGDEAHTGMP